MKPPAIVRLLLKNWAVILVSMVICGGGAFAVSKAITPQFSSLSAVYLTLSTGSDGANLAQGSNFLQDQMDSYGELATSPLILNRVIDDLHLDTTAKDLGRTVTAEVPRNTVILNVTATNPDPSEAAAIANAVTAEFSKELINVGPRTIRGVRLVQAQTIQTALPPQFQTSPNTKLNTAIGLLVGLAVGCAIVYAAGRLNHMVRTQAGAEATVNVPVVGMLRHAASASPGLVVARSLDDPLAADFQHLTAVAARLAEGSSQVWAVMSPGFREGRSTIAANLAAALTATSRKVLLIDADFRHPRLHELTGTPKDPGLIDLLTVEDFAQTPIKSTSANLDVLVAGGTTANPVALLSRPQMAERLADFRTRYDLVLVDTPPVLPHADALSLGGSLDGTVIVSNARRTTREELSETVRQIKAAGVKPIGLVLNEVSADDMPSHTRRPDRVSSKPSAWSAEEAASSDQAAVGDDDGVTEASEPDASSPSASPRASD